MPRCRASLEPIISVEFKFVAKKTAASGIIQAAKLKFVNLQKVKHESTLRNMLPHLALQHCILLRDKLVTKVVIRACNGVF